MRARPLVERTSFVRSPPPRALSAGFALALGLHLLGLAALALLRQPSSTAAAPVARPPEEPLIWLEPAEASSLVAEEAATKANAEDNEASRAAARQRVALAVRPRHSPRKGATSAQGEAASEGGASQADGTVETPDEGAALEAPAPAARVDKRLSLDALGVGPGHNPFLAPSGGRPAANALGQRIDHVLRSALAEHDRKLGLGPEGPAVAAVTELVMQSTTAPNSDALLVLRTDGKGETVHVEVAESSGDPSAWNDVARALLQALHGKKLRVPPGSGGVTMQLRVGSRVQLASGADPGLAIDLFGQEIKAGAGDRSTRLQLLTPKIVVEQYQISSTDPHVKIPVIGLTVNILSVLGDPVDIGSVARRVVHAHLVSLETHPRDPGQ